MKKDTGFTLAELLVVIAILGVITVLIIPGLVRKMNKTGFEKQLASFYNDFSQAMTIAQGETKKFLSGTPLATTGTGGIIKNYMQVTKECKSSRTPCFAATYKSNDSSSSISSSAFCTTGYSMLLTNGAAICITAMTTNAARMKDNYSEVFVDTNGADPPNVGGKDLFRMNLYADTSIDEQVSPSQRPTANRSAIIGRCLSSPTGEGCFTRFMEDGMKFEYYD